MKKIFLTIFSLIAVAFVSCETPIEFYGDEADSKITINSYVHADSTVSMHLSYSRFFLSSLPFQPINNAEITLDVNGVTQSANFISDGDYKVYYKPQPGDTLTIHANVAGHDEVYAGTRVPKTASVSDMRVQEIVTDNGYYTTQKVKVSFTLNDDASVHNYYCIRAYIVDTALSTEITRDSVTNMPDTTYSKVYVHENLSYTLEDVLLVDNGSGLGAIEGAIENDMYSYYGNHFTFNDDKINGRSHQMSFEVEYIPHGFYVSEDSRVGKGKNSYGYDDDYVYVDFQNPRIILEVESLSRELYYYLISVDKQRNQDELTGTFSEPVTIQCNVKGGYGVFGASSKAFFEAPINFELNKKKK